jgi:hypothetical protein
VISGRQKQQWYSAMAKDENRAPCKDGLDEVAINGAGFGGLGVAIRMQQRFIGTT